MDVTPVFADSLGAKSFCFRVDTGETSVLVDPGAAPFPKDHPVLDEDARRERLAEARQAIAEAADRVEHVVITHWHGDHHTSADEGVDLARLYGGKTLWVKDPRAMINPGQERKAHRFFEDLQDTFGGGYNQGELPTPTGVTVRGADGSRIIHDETVVAFSRPLPHGRKGSNQGYVLAVAITHGDEVLVLSSDVQGPGSKDAYRWILDQDPTHLVLDGPPTYLIGRYDVTEKGCRRGIDRAGMLLQRTEPEWAIYDHHLCREPGYRDRCPELWEAGARTVAEALGRPDWQELA